MLRNLSGKKMHAFADSFVGTLRPVLFEKEDSQGQMYGYTDNYIRVAAPFDPELVNAIVDCSLGEFGPGGLLDAIPQVLSKHAIQHQS